MLELNITGHVGSVRYAVAGENPVLNISVATFRKVGEREFTDWVSGKVWGHRATKLRDHIEKGARLLLRGRPEARGYQRGDGTIVGELVLHVTDLEFLSGKSKSPDECCERQLALVEHEPKRKNTSQTIEKSLRKRAG